MGDFNVVLGAHECSSGILTHSLPSEDFQRFIEQKDLFDLVAVGNKFTWSTRRTNNFVAARIDRAITSQDFLGLWQDVELLVLPMHGSNHSPLRLRASVGNPNISRPFRFQDMWTQHEGFLFFVRDC